MTIEYPERKFVRLSGFDYSQAGAYFVTICSYNKKCIFGHVIDADMHLNRLGVLVISTWKKLPHRYPFISLDSWIVMPNHFHGIVWLNEDNRNKRSLSEVIAIFKAASTSQAKKDFNQNTVLWQRGFYEHIIRDQNDLFRIRQYIEDNPVQWEVDCENPDFDGMVKDN